MGLKTSAWNLPGTKNVIGLYKLKII